jgi:uncharacterized protein (DUF1015 family)
MRMRCAESVRLDESIVNRQSSIKMAVPMAALIPFRALRPQTNVAQEVAAVPYDVVSTDEARALAHGHPLSFLHVSRAELGLPPDTDPYAEAVYEAARHNYARLKQQAPLVTDVRPTVYVYRLRMGDHSQIGVAACFSVDEYDADIIRKHEKTRKDKEDDRTRHIVELRAQTGPVFLTYPASADADEAVARVTMGPPLYDFTAADGVVHTIWAAREDDEAALVRAFGRIPRLYIADGHHRAASAARARHALNAATDGSPQKSDAFLAVAFPHNQVQILPYHRLVKDLAGCTPGKLIEAIRATHRLEPGPPVPSRQGEVAIFLAGQWLTLTLKKDVAAKSPIDALDVSLLQEQLLGPLLGIGDPRTDKRIDFVGGARGTAALESAVGRGAAAIAFSMYPVSVSDLMAIADAGDIMPPKSTWFEPKLRDGLLIHEI